VHVAMLGTRGVPAQYGGFETAVEEIGQRLVDRGHQVTVYCRNREQRITTYKGMRLVNLPALRKRSLETLSHTGLSVGHAMLQAPDVAVLFNAGNAPLIPLLKARRIPTAVHVDGLEWKRAKWRGVGARYYRRAEAMAARSGLPLIADAQGIADHLRAEYGVESHVIAYGAPVLEPGTDLLEHLGLTAGAFHLVVARMEPENHVDVMVEGFARARSDRPLVVVGSAPYGDAYIERVRNAAGDADVRLVGAVWDQELLNQLYAHATSYLHGHSVGGTNPSLLRALGCAAPVTAYDVSFNREVTSGHARFFTDADDVALAVAADDADPRCARVRGCAGQQHVAAAYRWDDVTDAYESLLSDMVRSPLRALTPLLDLEERPVGEST
jgi:glycosyltransferase involved in cell wall biosynthesis